MSSVTIIGGGLAGTECAFQLAERGIDVTIVEQKPHKRTPAQTSDTLAELVCSNSFRGASLTNAVGLIKEEMRRAGSLVMDVGDETRVPAGGAFAVDRERFSRAMTERVSRHPRIRVEHREVEAIPAPVEGDHVVIATGPLTGDALAADLARVIGTSHLAYYDAIAPIIAADSIDTSKTFRASRYDKGGDDAYLNCPLDREQYEAFVKAIVAAEKVEAKSFESIKYFEGCLPIEVMAERGPRTLSFGPMKPVGLTDPRTGRWPRGGVVQLRPEDEDRTAYNMVGFQTRMKWPEQKRVFAMIPGLENAEYLRYGSVHRNTFVDAPRVLGEALALRARPDVHLAGQITGVEGYVESAASGLVLGTMLAAIMRGVTPTLPPATTALGALMRHLARESDRFQPSNVVFSMFPSIETTARKRERYALLAERALADLEPWIDTIGARALPTAHRSSEEPAAETRVEPAPSMMVEGS